MMIREQSQETDKLNGSQLGELPESDIESDDEGCEKVHQDMISILNEIQDEKKNLRLRVVRKFFNVYKRDPHNFLQLFIKQIIYIASQVNKIKKKMFANYQKLICKTLLEIFKDCMENYNKRGAKETRNALEDILSLIFSFCRVKKPLAISSFGFEILNQLALKSNEQIFIKVMSQGEIRVKFIQCVTFFLSDKKSARKKLGMKLYAKFLTEVYKNCVPQAQRSEREISNLELAQLLYMNIIVNDKSSEMRRFSLTNFSLNSSNSSIILTRVNDIDDKVKIAFFENLNNSLYKFNRFSMIEKIYLISSGVRNKNPIIQRMFYEYFLTTIFGENNEENDRNSLTAVDVSSRVTQFLDGIDYNLLRFYPGYHNDVRLFLRELLKRCGEVTFGKILVMCSKLLKETPSCMTGELMLIDVLIDLVMNPNVYLGERETSEITEFYAKIEESFPAIGDIVNQAEDFWDSYSKSSKKDLVKMYYFVKIMGHLLKYDESSKDSVLTKLEFFIKVMGTDDTNIEDIFEEYRAEYDDQEEDSEARSPLLENLLQDVGEFRKRYWTQEASETPMIIFETDIFSSVLKIYYTLSFEDQSNFTRRIMEEVNYFFDKIPEHKIKSRLDPQEEEMRGYERQINQLSRVRNDEEIKRLRKDYENAQRDLDKIGFRLTKSIRKSIYLFKSLLEIIPMGQKKLDDSLKFSTSIFEKMLRLPYKNRDMLVLFLKTTSRFKILTEAQAKEHFGSFVQELQKAEEIEEQSGNCFDPELEKIISFEIIKKCIVLQNCFDCFMLYNLIETNEENQENIDEILEEDENAKNAVLEILKLLFCEIEEISGMSIKGVSKMLLHRDYGSQIDYITFLMLRWQDINLRKDKLHGLIQLLTNFFYNYISQSYEKIEEFMKAGAYLATLFIVDGDCQNPFEKVVDWQMFPKGTTFKVFLNTMLTLLSYSKNSILKKKRLDEDWKCLGPFEIFFVFLLRSFSSIDTHRKKKFLFAALEPILPHLDFFEFCPKEILVAINDELEILLKEFNDKMKNSNFGDLILKLKEVISQKTEEDLHKLGELTPEMQLELTENLESSVKEFKGEFTVFQESVQEDSRTLYKDLLHLGIATSESKRKAWVEEISSDEDSQDSLSQAAKNEVIEDETDYDEDYVAGSVSGDSYVSSRKARRKNKGEESRIVESEYREMKFH